MSYLYKYEKSLCEDDEMSELLAVGKANKMMTGFSHIAGCSSYMLQMLLVHWHNG